MSEQASVNVRRATAEDLPEVVALFDELSRLQREWRVFTPRPGFYDEVHDKYSHALERPDAVVVVAEDQGEVVGVAYGEIDTPSRHSDERALEISGVAVRSGRRGQGVGRAMVAEISRFAEDQGIRWVEMKTFAPNEAAMRFWRGLGFNPRVIQLIAPTDDVVRLTKETA